MDLHEWSGMALGSQLEMGGASNIGDSPAYQNQEAPILSAVPFPIKLRTMYRGFVHVAAAMVKRSCSDDIYMDELRDLLTYDCPLTGEKRCPPCLKENIPRTQNCNRNETAFVLGCMPCMHACAHG